MKIENIRLGLATNSSSSHSIIFNLSDKSRDWENAEFGWNEFVCNCKDSKTMYLASALYDSLRETVGDTIADAVIQAWVGIELPKQDGKWFYGIDHQSVPIVPSDPKTGEISKEFFDDLLSYYLRSDIAIVGGNDNEDCMTFDNRKSHIVPTEGSKNQYVCRKDISTGHWVIFNNYNGAKIRLHFNENAPDYTKSFAPELVDVKITDYCPIGCKYCFQDSTKDGIHADMDFIRSIVYQLSDMRVFEVALGGGETTMHPDFPEILRLFRNHGIIPNFTTRSYKWVHDDKIREAVKEFGGRFAISVNTAEDVKRAYYVLDEFDMASPQGKRHMSFQYVMGSEPKDKFKEMLHSIPWSGSLLLLGYKDVGRGPNFKPHDYSNWLKIIEDERIRLQIGIDTTLAAEFKDEILEKVDKRLVTFDEGKFSMYIDAVAQKAAPSSYCEKSEHVSVDNFTDWIELFGKF